MKRLCFIIAAGFIAQFAIAQENNNDSNGNHCGCPPKSMVEPILFPQILNAEQEVITAITSSEVSNNCHILGGSGGECAGSCTYVITSVTSYSKISIGDPSSLATYSTKDTTISCSPFY